MSNFAIMLDILTLCEMIKDDNGVSTKKKIDLLKEQIDLHVEFVELLRNKKNKLVDQLLKESENS